MHFVELGRLVTPISKTARNTFAVITGIQDKNFIIIQSPLTMKRARVAIKTIKLLDFVIPVKNDDTAFNVQRSIDSNGAVRDFESTDDYKECENMNQYMKANDFERFMIDMRKRVEMDVLREIKLI